MSQLLEIARRFVLDAAVKSVEPHGRGLINDTFLVTLDAHPPRAAILQRINTRVFAQPAWIMENLRVLGAHAAQHHAATPLVFPAIYATADGTPFARDAEGGFWRAQQFIPDARTIDAPESAARARQLGAALGAFHALLADVPCARLHTTLPGFHITPAYLSRFDAVLAADAAAGRAADVRECMDFVAARRAGAAVLEDAKQRGELRLRVTHGDPKIDNFLFDAQGRAISLIDLDTVQPGLIHYDIGDLVRSACNRGGESARGMRAEFDLAACAAILEGYVASARALLAAADFDCLYAAIRLIPFELGLRFLTDHLAGDTYFKTTRRGENLERARIQFDLTQRIEAAEHEIRRVIETLRTTA